ncbi:MAG: 23S rRNA (adenine(2503)-C(2))-methyltransferase RlmN [Myxococcales bacterium]|nr:23S rRNA (adenine(2503)-C(2))-methyltransferase RlmN [Myxococcales bacterium]
MFDIRNASLVSLEAWLSSLGESPYRAKQIFRWLHQRGARSFNEMTDLSKELRQRLGQQAVINCLEISSREIARDGTRKYALRGHRSDTIEAVFIPDASSSGRNTLCISSQVGCAIDCQFCLTASLGLIRNLESGEMVEQITRVKEDLEHSASLEGKEQHGDYLPASLSRSGRVPSIGNIVFMGMGEPLQNYSRLVEAVGIITHSLGHHISPRRITVSTSGIVPKIEQLGRDTSVQLAISLNATTDDIRDQIMPINRRWNIQALLRACRQYPLKERRRITFEYVMLAGLNDTDEDAYRLVKLLRGLRAKVNLIPFNEHPYSPYQRPSASRTAKFQAILRSRGYTVLIRTPRGDDISAACGQLGVEVQAPRTSATERGQRLRVVS